MTKEEIIHMAREAGFESHDISLNFPKELERFAALVEAHVNAKEKERQRYDVHSCGPDCDRYICVAVRKAREEERQIWLKTASVVAKGHQ